MSSDTPHNSPLAAADRCELPPELHSDETAEARRLIADLYILRPAIYWVELILLALTGWGAMALAVKWGLAAWQTYPAAMIAALALYRASIFSHEISHFHAKALPGYRNAWDALIGVPLMVPSFIYVGMHKDHHKISTYGTAADPEYLPMAGRKGQIIRFTAGSFLLPALCALRFLILAPIGFCSRRFHDVLERHASSLTINHEYERHMSDTERSRMFKIEAVTFAVWTAAIILAVAHVLPWRTFGLWYAVLAASGLINTIRTLGAHRYESDGRPMTRLEQLQDSIDTPGRFWSELWAPVGLRYHALHHYFPGLPYHNLGKAYWRLSASLAAEAIYRQSTSPSLADSLRALWNHPQIVPREPQTAPLSSQSEPPSREGRAA
jgi:fatty acid desaturase